MNDNNMEERLTAFKMLLLRKMPFYGDLLTNIPIVSDPTIPTACTDGRTIRFNPVFFRMHTEGEQHFIIMHEVMHMLMLHCVRGRGKDARIFNVAADMVVNGELMRLRGSMQTAGINFAAPKDGIFHPEYSMNTVEDAYERLLKVNREQSDKIRKKKVAIQKGYGSGQHIIHIDAPDDLLISLSGEEDPSQGAFPGEADIFLPGTPVETNAEAIEEHIAALIRHAEETAAKSRNPYGSYYIPSQLYSLAESRYLPWKRLLKDFLMDKASDDVSYATPERKYLHMDLILPGHGETEETLENIWAFVDSSGSVGKDEMSEFLTQLYRIMKEFHCRMNLAYWDTKVTDIYKNIKGEQNILNSLPHHSGGTDINCVYRWIAENKVKPDVMVILTDGYYGTLQESNRIPSLRKKTILVLSKRGATINEEMKKLGKVTKL